MQMELADPPLRTAGFGSVNDQSQRGAEIKRRRLALGINSIAELSRKTGIARDTLAKVEQGVASRDSFLRVEEWLTQVEANTLPDGVAVLSSEDLDEETIEVAVEGPTTKFRFIARGKPSQADDLRRQALQFILDYERAQGERD